MDDWTKKTILVTGATGLVGSCLCRRLAAMGCRVAACGHSRHADLTADLRDPGDAREIFDAVEPEVVFHLAARVGGIQANMEQKAAFYLDNTLINANVVREVHRRRLPYVFAMGTGCAYPKRLEGAVLCEEDFLDGVPEPTNDAYAYAKRNLLVHLQACREETGLEFCYCIPANIYGPRDNFHPEHSHVVPGLIRRFAAVREEGAPNAAVWGWGRARRDFLYIEDLVDAMILLAGAGHTGPVNVATGQPVAIADLADRIRAAVGYGGGIIWDIDRPEGQAVRLFDTQKIRALGWAPKHTLEQGLQKTVEWYRNDRTD